MAAFGLACVASFSKHNVKVCACMQLGRVHETAPQADRLTL